MTHNDIRRGHCHGQLEGCQCKPGQAATILRMGTKQTQIRQGNISTATTRPVTSRGRITIRADWAGPGPVRTAVTAGPSQWLGKMPRKHWKGDIAVPTFIASGSGRDMYLDPQASKDARQDHTQSKAITYKDEASGQTRHLRWWTRLPASVEFLERKKKQRQAALRLSQLPKLKSPDVVRQQENTRARLALEPFNPWNVERQEIKNFALNFRANSMGQKP